MLDTRHTRGRGQASGEAPSPRGAAGQLPAAGDHAGRALIELAIGIVAAVVVAALALLAFLLFAAPARSDQHLGPPAPAPAGVTVLYDGAESAV
ncbi:hypothetical protein [Leucobacter luti]|uniref:hypothetical protein n=1 Tax=Leucobacter luti TaxID=340320 RepID=UPI003CFC1838